MESSLKKLKFFIYIKIISIETCKEKHFPYSKYTQYKIKIFSNDKIWELNRRYSSFYELNQKISKKFNNIPKFPPKKLFTTNAVIKERQEKLEKYLNIILNRDDVYKFDEIFDFIEMEKEYYLMLKKNIEEDSTNDNSLFSTDISNKVKSLIKNNFKKSKSYEVIIKENFFYSECNSVSEKKIFKFLQNNNERNKNTEKEFNHNERKYSIQIDKINFKSSFLKENKDKNFLNKFVSSFLKDLNKKIENRCEVIKNFARKWNQNNSELNFESEHAYKIIFGELNTEKNVSRNDRYMFGVLHHAGLIEENMLGAETCLEFLSKLIDCQYNFNSDFFICLLKSANVPELLQINIPKHLKNNKSNVNYACYKILEVVSECENQTGFKLDYLIKEQELREKYYKWLTNRL